MKFGKSLSSQIVETLPEWRDKFLSYKDLKKRLKLIGIGADGEERQAKRARVSEPAGDGDETAAAAAAAEDATQSAKAPVSDGKRRPEATLIPSGFRGGGRD